MREGDIGADLVLLVGSPARAEACFSSDVDLNLMVPPGHILLSDRPKDYAKARQLRRDRVAPLVCAIVEMAFRDDPRYAALRGSERAFVYAQNELLGWRTDLPGLRYGRAADSRGNRDSYMRCPG